MLPKRRYWMAERTFGNALSKYFSKERSTIEYSPPNVPSMLPNADFGGPNNDLRLCFWTDFQWVANAFWNVGSAFQNLRLGWVKFMLPNADFGKSYKRWNACFRCPFKGVSTWFGLRAIEKCIEHPLFIFCSFFQNLRLGSINLLQKDSINRTTPSEKSSFGGGCILCSNIARMGLHIHEDRLM